ncbi:MAG: HAD family hydrolase [Nitrososphaerales archaeon]
MIKGLLIDLDGTVTKYNIDYQSMRKDLVSKLVDLNASLPEYGDMPIFAILISVKARHNEEEYSKIKNDVFPILGRYEQEAAQHVEPQVGVNSAIEELKKMKIKLGLVTNNSKDPTITILTRFGLKESFNSIITRDETLELKPDPKGVLICLDQMGISASEAMYVGDAIIDVDVAKKVGMPSVIVPSGPSRLERILAGSQPDFILNNIKEVPELLKNLNRA